MAPSEETVKTRILIMSDTRNFDLSDADHCRAFSRPVPRVDLLLHCGDLTNTGSLEEYKLALNMLASIPASLKLVIAGKRDVSLDSDWWQAYAQDHRFNRDEPRRARELMTGGLAQAAGVNYLEEGTHSFNLPNGAKFTIYTSSYQPIDPQWAFHLPRHQDRFNTRSQSLTGVTPVGHNPIPNFPSIDIVMTHTAPLGVWDHTDKGGNVGCANLLRAMQRARPLLHCYGHIHEARGALLASWKPRHRRAGGEGAADLREPVFERRRQLPDTYPTPVDCAVDFGHETLMVNASVMDANKMLRNRPYIFELDLPTKTNWKARNAAATKSSGLLCCKKPATLP